jgi:lysozyme
MIASENCINLIKRFEGFTSKAYKCPAGKLTIGYGETENVINGQVVTEEMADKKLRDRVNELSKKISSILEVSLNQNQFDAIVSLAFNIGLTAFACSTLFYHLNLGEFDVAARQFSMWDKIKGKICEGLVNRRNAEKELFLRAY